MKTLITMLLLTAPAAASAMGMHGGMRPGCAPALGLHLAVALYALLAALGYWLLQHSAKESANYVKRAGQTLGWALLVIGLLGVLCGVTNHAKMGMSRGCRPEAEVTEAGKMDAELPARPGHQMPIELRQKPQTAPKNK